MPRYSDCGARFFSFVIMVKYFRYTEGPTNSVQSKLSFYKDSPMSTVLRI